MDRRGGRCIHAFILHPLLISVEFLICTRVMVFGLFDLHVGLVLSLASRASSSSALEHDQAYGHEFLLQPERSACIAITILVRLQQVNRTLID